MWHYDSAGYFEKKKNIPYLDGGSVTGTLIQVQGPSSSTIISFEMDQILTYSNIV